jgi:hypothetical protein
VESPLANLGKQKSGLLQNDEVGATAFGGAHFRSSLIDAET